MVHSRRRTAAAFAVAFVAVEAPAAAQTPPAPATTGRAAAPDVPLQPHRAVYDLSLHRSGAAADMVSVKGRLVYDIAGSACEGFTVKSRFVTQIVDREGVTSTTDVRSSSFETVDPPRFSFSNEQYVDEGLASVVRGTAEARADGIAVTLEEPKAAEATLPRAVFPTAHTMLALEAARNGDRVLEAPIYDGGENADTVYQTTTVIGPSETGLPAAAPDETAALGAMADADTARSRHFVVSYFETAAEGEPTPRYVLTFEMLDNGVSYAATFDYGEFVLSGRLAELDLTAAAPCGDGVPAPAQ